MKYHLSKVGKEYCIIKDGVIVARFDKEEEAKHFIDVAAWLDARQTIIPPDKPH